MTTSHTAIEKAKAKNSAFRISDGRGLYVLVKPNGSKLWRFDYSLKGRRNTTGLGSFPATSLKDARKRAEEMRELIEKGIDPVQHKRDERASEEAAAANSFRVLAEEWFVIKKSGWSEGHVVSIRQRLDNHILPQIGDKPVAELEPQVLLPVLRRLENRGNIESAKRVRIIISQVFRYGIATGRAARDEAADLKGALMPPKTKPMAAVTEPEEVGALLRAIDEYQGDITTKLGLQILAHTFVRPGELRRAEWVEIAWPVKQWRIPAEKMKGRREHVVPLSDQVLDLLQQLHQFTGEGQYLLPSARTGSRPISDNTLNAALRRMGFSKEEIVAHGFRSTASTLLNEAEVDPYLIELQLAHKQRGVAGIYNRAERLQERRNLMQKYSDMLDGLSGKGNNTRRAAK